MEESQEECPDKTEIVLVCRNDSVPLFLQKCGDALGGNFVPKLAFLRKFHTPLRSLSFLRDGDVVELSRGSLEVKRTEYFTSLFQFADPESMQNFGMQYYGTATQVSVIMFFMSILFFMFPPSGLRSSGESATNAYYAFNLLSLVGAAGSFTASGIIFGYSGFFVRRYTLFFSAWPNWLFAFLVPFCQLACLGSLVIICMIIVYVNAQPQFLWLAIVAGVTLLLLLYLWIHSTWFTVKLFTDDFRDLRGQSTDHYLKSHANGSSSAVGSSASL